MFGLKRREFMALSAVLPRAMGSNDQCEQFNYGDSDHQHCKCYRIVIEPMLPLYVHDTPASN
jgi:hypothetical protein